MSGEMPQVLYSHRARPLLTSAFSPDRHPCTNVQNDKILPDRNVTKLFACLHVYKDSNVTRIICLRPPILVRGTFPPNGAHYSGCGAPRQPRLDTPTTSVVALYITAFTHHPFSLSPFTSASHESARVSRDILHHSASAICLQ